MRNKKGLLSAAALAAATATAFALSGSATTAASPKVGEIGPSTTTAPYLIPSPGMEGKVNLTSILTVGDAINGYKLVGLPDGMGALKGPGNSLRLYVNHEIPATSGIVRAHGSTGAFVSQWEVNRHTLAVTSGKDMVQAASDVYVWDTVAKAYNAVTTAIQRLCSGDMPALSAFWHNGVGTRDRIYLNGEETDRGRAFGWVATGDHAGEVWELPRLGKFAWENAVASPHGQSKTIVIPMDDADLSTSATTAFPSELAVYVGTKQNTGHPIERAGLTNGKLYGVKVAVNGALVTEESNTNGLGSAGYESAGRFTLVEMGDNGDVSSKTADELRNEFIAKDILRLQRIEDGAFDPRNGKQNDFYFVTTASMTLNSRLWRLRFDDIENPLAGGRIEILVNGGDVRMLDNIGMDGHGRIIMQEDPGNVSHIAKVWLYGADTGTLTQIAQFDPEQFTPGMPAFLTQDEESSGVFDAEETLGKGYFLLNAQVHRTPLGPELIERAQLLAMYVDPSLK